MQEEILKDINNHYLLLLTKSDLEKKIKEDNEKIYRKMQTNVKYKSNDFSLNIKLQEIEKKIEMISQRIINSFKYMTKIESSSLQSVLETEIASYDRQTLANSQKIELLKMEIEKNNIIISKGNAIKQKSKKYINNNLHLFVSELHDVQEKLFIKINLYKEYHDVLSDIFADHKTKKLTN